MIKKCLGKLTAILLAIMMLLCLIPITAFAAETISLAIVTVTLPEAGESPDMKITVGNSDKYTATINCWYLYEAPYPHINTTDTFQAGETYCLRVVFEAKPGYTFDSSTEFLVNGKQTNSYGPVRMREVKFTVSETPIERIGTVSLTVPEPKTGEKPAANATATQSNYNVAAVLWDPIDERFAANKVYTAIISLEAKDGDVFSESPNITINGKKANIISGTGSQEMRISYSFPATTQVAKKPTITTQPLSGSYTIGKMAYLNVTAKSNDGGTLAYQWYNTRVNDISTIKAISSDDSSSYGRQSSFAPPQEEGTVYYCVMVTNEIKKDGKVVSSDFVYSNLVKVTFKEAPATVEGISITSNPNKLTYKLGDTLNTNGLKLRVVMSDGYKDVTSGFTCSPTTLKVVGTQKITVTYQGKTASFDVSVAKSEDDGGELSISGIGIISLPKKVDYVKGEAFNPEGLIIKINLSEGGWLQGNNYDDMTFSPTKLDIVGTQKIAVTYMGKTASFDINVIDKDHVHIFTDSYKSDSTQHWNECECGEKTNISSHTFGEGMIVKAQTDTEEGIIKRACTVCGYEDYEIVPTETELTTDKDELDTTEDDTKGKNDSEDNLSYYLIVIGVVVTFLVLSLIIVMSKRKKRNGNN